MTEQPVNENTRRLRATVRTFVSPAAWLFILFPVTLTLVAKLLVWLLGGGVTLPIMFLYLFGLVYLAAGIYQAMAHGGDVVSIPAMLNGARTEFARFLALMLKAILLLVLVVFIFTPLFPFDKEMEVQDMQRVIMENQQHISLIVSVVLFALVFWLPTVFVSGDFRLFPGLSAALRAIVTYRRSSVFLAVLMIGPSLVAWLIPGKSPIAIFIGIEVIGRLSALVAFVYCVDLLRSRAAPTISPQAV